MGAVLFPGGWSSDGSDKTNRKMLAIYCTLIQVTPWSGCSGRILSGCLCLAVIFGFSFGT
jgi:hypothetical protein